MHNTRSSSLTVCVCFIRQTIPPIPKSSQSPTQEYESSLSKEESLGTSTRSTSGPSSPRNPAVGEVKQKADCYACVCCMWSWSPQLIKDQLYFDLRVTKALASLNYTLCLINTDVVAMLLSLWGTVPFSHAARVYVRVNCESHKGWIPLRILHITCSELWK